MEIFFTNVFFTTLCMYIIKQISPIGFNPIGLIYLIPIVA
jgi:hypothetical protein